jgi:hypothetical protein
MTPTTAPTKPTNNAPPPAMPPPAIKDETAAAAPVSKTPEERKAALAQVVANVTAQGYRIESQSDFQAVIVKGKRINHPLHIVLSLLTGVWLIGYLIILVTGGEKREITQVDAWGNVVRQTV